MPHTPPPYAGPPYLDKKLMAATVPLQDAVQALLNNPGAVLFVAIDGVDVVGSHGFTQYRQIKNVDINRGDGESLPATITFWEGPDVTSDGNKETPVILLEQAT